jgi:hypothetical protein
MSSARISTLPADWHQLRRRAWHQRRRQDVRRGAEGLRRAHVVGLYDQCVAERRPLYSESLFFRSNAAVDRHLKVLFMPLSADAVTVGMVFVVQIIEFIDETIRDRHFISTNRHKELTRALL